MMKGACGRKKRCDREPRPLPRARPLPAPHRHHRAEVVDRGVLASAL